MREWSLTLPAMISLPRSGGDATQEVISGDEKNKIKTMKKKDVFSIRMVKTSGRIKKSTPVPGQPRTYYTSWGIPSNLAITGNFTLAHNNHR